MQRLFDFIQSESSIHTKPYGKYFKFGFHLWISYRYECHVISRHLRYVWIMFATNASQPNLLCYNNTEFLFSGLNFKLINCDLHVVIN